MPTQIEILSNHPDIQIKEKPAQELVSHILKDELLPAREVNVIFVNDEYLKQLHRDFLNDDTYTDVITFDLSKPHAKEVEGEIYISVERADIHAREFQVSFLEEIGRLIIHGMLHLKGYDDQTENGRKEMRKKEDFYLQKYQELIALL